LAKKSGKKATVERKDLKCIGWQKPHGSTATESQWQEEELHVPGGLVTGADISSAWNSQT
jgi:hypothetical protein